MKRLPYNTVTLVYTRSGFIDVVNNCNAFTFVNVGDTIANVNGMIIYPGTVGTNLGDARQIGGNEGEVYIGTIKLAFDFPGGANPAVEITQKFYIDEPSR